LKQNLAENANVTLLTEEALASVGTSSQPRWGTVTDSAIRKFATGIDDSNPLFRDPAAARAAGYDNVIAPPLFNSAAVRPTPFREGFLTDGQYETTAPSGLTHLQTMLAGQRWELLRPSVAGEEICEVMSTRSITEKQGKTGPIVFVEKAAEVTTRGGEVIERSVSTLILRTAPPPLPPFQGIAASRDHAPELPATEWDGATLIKRPDMISLFLFAAAAWCVHRIHWDVAYAQSEGLPAPIFPGWVISSYLAQLAQARAPNGARLQMLDVRYRASMFPGDTVRCSAVAKEGALTLTAVNQHGQELSSAAANFIAA
jgi:3-methylfumaryl-CoA hydratase